MMTNICREKEIIKMTFYIWSKKENNNCYYTNVKEIRVNESM